MTDREQTLPSRGTLNVERHARYFREDKASRHALIAQERHEELISVLSRIADRLDSWSDQNTKSGIKTLQTAEHAHEQQVTRT